MFFMGRYGLWWLYIDVSFGIWPLFQADGAGFGKAGCSPGAWEELGASQGRQREAAPAEPTGGIARMARGA